MAGKPIDNSIIILRDTVTYADPAIVSEIIDSTAMFHEYEVDIAVELVLEALLRKESSGYNFLFAEYEGKGVGYTCFGSIPCTKNSYDLYWIAVHKEYQNAGIGALLLRESELRIAKLGGLKIFIETSSRDLYKSTRIFYQKNNYLPVAEIKDFYAPGDNRVIFEKLIS